MAYENRGVAIPSVPGTWENGLYGGDVFAWKGKYQMLDSAPKPGMVNAIGLAESEDLPRWKKHPGNPVLAATFFFARRDPGVFGLFLENATGKAVANGIRCVL